MPGKPVFSRSFPRYPQGVAMEPFRAGGGGISTGAATSGGKGHLITRATLRDVFGKNPNKFGLALAIEPVGGKLFDLIAKFQELCITI
jgi:hypothetical protein